MSSSILEEALPKDDGKIFWDTQKQLAEEKHGPERFEKENMKKRSNRPMESNQIKNMIINY